MAKLIKENHEITPQRTVKQHNSPISKDVKQVIANYRKDLSHQQVQQQKKQQNYSSVPDWIYVNPKSGKKHVKVDILGELIYQQHKKQWLLIQDKDKVEFWSYRLLVHNSPSEAGTHKQYVWQLSNVNNIKGYIHQALAKQNCWSALAEANTFKYIVGAMETHIKLKDSTVGKIHENKMLMADGVLDVSTGKVMPNDPKYYFTDYADYNIKDANTDGASHIKQWFSDTFGYAALPLEQYIGYMFYTNYSLLQGFVILVNTGGEGKTTIINFISSLMPPSEVSNVSLQQLTQSEKMSKNFSVSELYHKRLNAADDITGEFIQDGSKLKTVTGGGMMNASVKNKGDVRFINYAKLLFACNELPRFKDTSNGWARRPYIIKAYSLDFRKKYDMKQLYQERGSFVIYCIKQFQQRLNEQIEHSVINPRLTETPAMIADLGQWLYNNDPIKQFLDDRVIPKKELPDKGKQTRNNCRRAVDTYRAYQTWASQAGIEALSRPKFYQALIEKGYQIKHTTVDGESTNWIIGMRFYTDPNKSKDIIHIHQKNK